MLRHVLITGPAEGQSSQTHAVFNDANGFPSGQTWEINVGALTVAKEEFFENLFFSTEKNGGNSYFYPNVDANCTTCRYEWHLPWRNRAAQIRLGLIFEVQRGDAPNVGLAYLGTNNGYEDRGSTNYPAKISKRKFSEFQNFLISEVIKANTPRSQREQQSWQFILYAKGSVCYWSKPFLALDRTMLVLPPRLDEGVLRTAVVIRSTGITKGEAHRKAMRKFHLTLALLSLATGGTWQASDYIGKYELMEGKLRVRSELANELFPDGTYPKALGSNLPVCAVAIIRYGLAILDSNKASSGKLLRALFAYYGGMLANSKTPSLASVAFTASLGVFAGTNQVKCSGRIECSECGQLDWQHNLVGDRAAISELVAAALNRVFGADFTGNQQFQAWVKKVYNAHRSQYVHSASHQFSEFSQVFSRKSPSTTLVPTAIPSKGKLARSENEHRAVISKLPTVTRVVLIDKLLEKANVSRVVDKLGIQQPEFLVTVEEEGFVGLPTSGWVRMV